MSRPPLSSRFTNALCTTVAVLSLALSSNCTCAARESKADLVIFNAAIHTMDPAKPLASALAVSGQKILKVGNDTEIKALAASDTRMLDAHGKLVLPGFQDSHVHLAEGAAEAHGLNLNKAHTKDEALKMVASFIKSHKEDTQYVVNGLPLPAMDKEEITADALDRLTEKPLVIYSEDAHTAWMNSATLAKLQKVSSQEDLDLLEKDSKGQPTGVLRELLLTRLDEVIEPAPLEKRVQYLREIVATANSFGITAIQDAHATEAILATYARLDRENALNLRVSAAQHTFKGMSENDFDKLVERAKNYSGSNLKINTVKIFADGVIETGTAALLSPYLKDGKASQSAGSLNFPPEELKQLVQEIVKRDFQIHIHAIGDRAVRESLDALALVREKSAKRDLRHVIAHLEMIDRQDIPRFAELGVVADFQPYWSFRDPYVEKLTRPLLGDERTNAIYPIASVLKSGAHIAAGSDWTVSTLNPLDAITVAVTRRRPGCPKDNPLNENEAISTEEAVAAYTTGGAYLAGRESELGTLSAGKYADLIMLDKNIFQMPKSEIYKSKVVLTLIGGKTVFSKLAGWAK